MLLNQCRRKSGPLPLGNRQTCQRILKNLRNFQVNLQTSQRIFIIPIQNLQESSNSGPKPSKILKNPKESQRILKNLGNFEKNLQESEGILIIMSEILQESLRIPKNPKESWWLLLESFKNLHKYQKNPKESQRIPENPRESLRPSWIDLITTITNTVNIIMIINNGAVPLKSAELMIRKRAKAMLASASARLSRKNSAAIDLISRPNGQVQWSGIKFYPIIAFMSALDYFFLFFLSFFLSFFLLLFP